jgi:uncharacterized protein YoxC
VKLAVQTAFTALDHMTGPMAGMTRSAIRNAEKMKHAGEGIGASWGKLRNIVGGVAAVLGTGAVAVGIKKFADRGDEISRMANILGLSTTAFQEFEIAARKSDMTTEDLQAAFKKMNNSMGQLKTASGPLYVFLKKTNPELALQLKHTNNSEDAFMALTDAIAKETDTAKRAALTQAAFGRGGQPVIEMALHMRDLREEARNSGGMINPDDVQAAKEFHESLKTLTISGEGFLNRVLGRGVKALSPWIDKLNKWIDANRDLINQKIETTINKIASAAKTAYDIWKKWHPVIIAVGVAIVLMNNAVKIGMIIQAFSKAIAIATAVMAMFQAGASFATVAQWALNAAMDANPVGLVIIAIAALVAIMILLIKYQKEITEGLRQAWNWFNKMFNNPAIKLALYAFAAPLAIIASFIKTIVDLLNGEGWKSFANLAGPWKALTDVLGLAKGGGNIGGVSPNLGVINSNSTSTRNVNVDVGFNNAPAGTSIQQRGTAPGITVSTFNTLRGM